MGSRLAAATLALCVALQGCRTYFPENDPLSGPAQDRYSARLRWSDERSSELLLIVAFSGGGTRAAAFGYGVLGELANTRVEIDGRERSLLEEIDHVAGVSGGSFPAAYFGLHGRGIFENFEERFLKRNVQRSLILQLFYPWNWVLLFSPYFERSDLVARYYDRILFDDATFGDLAASGGPLVQVNATDLATGAPFSFIQEQFDFLCSDLRSYPISRAIAASSAVPGPMSPITLKNFAGGCDFRPPQWVDEVVAERDAFGRAYANARNLSSYLDADQRRYIRLIDGGVSDNLAVRGPFESDVLRTPTGAERSRRPKRWGDLRYVVLVVVNAATSPETAWEALDEAPGLANIIGQTTTVQINRYSIETIERLRQAFGSWNAAGKGWKEPLSFHLVELDFARVEDSVERSYLNSLPTSFHLEPEAVDLLEAAGRTTLRGSPPFKLFLDEAGVAPPAP